MSAHPHDYRALHRTRMRPGSEDGRACSQTGEPNKHSKNLMAYVLALVYAKMFLQRSLTRSQIQTTQGHVHTAHMHYIPSEHLTPTTPNDGDSDDHAAADGGWCFSKDLCPS